MESDREFAVLHEIAAALNASVQLDEALETTLEKAGELMGLETGWIWLFGDESGDPYLAASRNLPAGLRERPELMEGRCYCLNSFEEGDLEGAANVNVVRCSRLQQLDEGTEGFAFHTSVPLYGRDESRLGIMNLATTDWRELDDDELQTLRTVSDLVAMAVERTRLFERSLQLGAAEERNRLAREMHDTIVQGLAGLVMQLESAEARLDGGEAPAGLREVLDRGIEMARENLREARSSVEDLRASPLRDQRVWEAIEELLEDRASNEGWEATFDGPETEASVSDRAETALFRVAQEGLANVVQHAEATVVRVAIEVDADRVVLVIEDDGVGFDVAPARDAHWGLVGMRERVDRIGGRFRVESERDQGTTVRAEVPRERR